MLRSFLNKIGEPFSWERVWSLYVLPLNKLIGLMENKLDRTQGAVPSSGVIRGLKKYLLKTYNVPGWWRFLKNCK